MRSYLASAIFNWAISRRLPTTTRCQASPSLRLSPTSKGSASVAGCLAGDVAGELTRVCVLLPPLLPVETGVNATQHRTPLPGRASLSRLVGTQEVSLSLLTCAAGLDRLSVLPTQSSTAKSCVNIYSLKQRTGTLKSPSHLLARH